MTDCLYSSDQIYPVYQLVTLQRPITTVSSVMRLSHEWYTVLVILLAVSVWLVQGPAGVFAIRWRMVLRGQSGNEVGWSNVKVGGGLMAITVHQTQAHTQTEIHMNRNTHMYSLTPPPHPHMHEHTLDVSLPLPLLHWHTRLYPG